MGVMDSLLSQLGLGSLNNALGNRYNAGPAPWANNIQSLLGKSQQYAQNAYNNAQSAYNLQGAAQAANHWSNARASASAAPQPPRRFRGSVYDDGAGRHFKPLSESR
jgi:hypothetical protein